MRIVTYTCDRCKAEAKEAELWDITMEYRNLTTYRSTYSSSYAPVVAQWCRPCMEETGFLNRPKKEDAVQEVEITLEDRIREIIRSEIP